MKAINNIERSKNHLGLLFVKFSVIMLENEILASCSNDLTIKIWG